MPGHEVGDHLGHTAVPSAREGAVEIDLVDRRHAGACQHRRQIERRQQDQAAVQLGGLEAAREFAERDRSLVFVAVHAAGAQQRRSGAALDHDDRCAHAPRPTRCWNTARSARRAACPEPRSRPSWIRDRARSCRLRHLVLPKRGIPSASLRTFAAIAFRHASVISARLHASARTTACRNRTSGQRTPVAVRSRPSAHAPRQPVIPSAGALAHLAMAG